MKKEGEEDSRRVLQKSVESVEVGVWWFDIHHKLGVLEILLRVDVRRRFESFPNLEIRLSVQVLRLDVADSIGVRGREDDNIGGYLLVVTEKNDVPNLELLPVESEGKKRKKKVSLRYSA